MRIPWYQTAATACLLVERRQGKLQVSQTLYKISGKGLVITEPKSGKSRRLIVLPGFVISALKAHQSRQNGLKGERRQEHGLVFTTDRGTPISPRNLVRHFKTKLEAAGLPEIRFHDLRHTAASLLLERNTHPKIVQELLGHSNITLTLDTYSHLLPFMQREAARTMDDLVGQK